MKRTEHKCPRCAVFTSMKCYCTDCVRVLRALPCCRTNIDKRYFAQDDSKRYTLFGRRERWA